MLRPQQKACFGGRNEQCLRLLIDLYVELSALLLLLGVRRL